MNRLQGFFIGNLIGLTILIIGIIVSAPQKLKEQERIDDAKKIINVVIVTADVKAGHKLKEGEIGFLAIEKGKAPPDSLLSFEQAIDKKLVSDMVPGNIIKQSDLALEKEANKAINDKKDKNNEATDQRVTRVEDGEEGAGSPNKQGDEASASTTKKEEKPGKSSKVDRSRSPHAGDDSTVGGQKQESKEQ